MGKIVIKTAIITALSLICATFLGVFLTFGFAPRFSAEICHSLGLKNLSISCYERVYKKTGEMEDLIELIDCSVYAEDKETVAEYGYKLFDLFGMSPEFEDFCKKGDESVSQDGYKTYDYYATTVMTALYSTGKKQQAATFSIVYVGSDGYTEKSVLKMAVLMANPELDQEFGELLISAYKNDRVLSTNVYTNFVSEMKSYELNGEKVYKF